MKKIFPLIALFVFPTVQVHAGGSMCTGAHEFGQKHQEYFLDWDTDGGDGNKNEQKVLTQAQAKYKAVRCKTFGYYPAHGVFVVVTNGQVYGLGAGENLETARGDAEISLQYSNTWKQGEDYTIVEKHSY